MSRKTLLEGIRVVPGVSLLSRQAANIKETGFTILENFTFEYGYCHGPAAPIKLPDTF